MTEELNTSSAQRHEKVQPEQKLKNQSSSIYGLERPATVFLSYAREDTEDVRDLQLRLNVRGVRVWRDDSDIPLGGCIASMSLCMPSKRNRQRQSFRG